MKEMLNKQKIKSSKNVIKENTVLMRMNVLNLGVKLSKIMRDDQNRCFRHS